jgi:hypothetical protein
MACSIPPPWYHKPLDTYWANNKQSLDTGLRLLPGKHFHEVVRITTPGLFPNPSSNQNGGCTWSPGWQPLEAAHP